MKRLLFTAMAVALLSCQLFAQTEFGVMSSGCAASNADAKLMHVKLVRNHVSIATGAGTRQMDTSLDYITNFEWNQGAFPSDLNIYESRLKALVATMPVLPKYAVIENEEDMNPDVATYCLMIAAAKRVFDMYGIPVLNGGITNSAAVALACDYYQRIGDKATASYLSKRNSRSGSVKFSRVKKEADFLRSLPDVPYFLFHYQLKDSSYTKDLGLIVAALKDVSGKEVGNNELAQRDYSTATTKAMVNASKCMPLVVLYITTGNAGNAATFTYDMKMAASAAMQ